MPRPEDTGYVLVHIELRDDDSPARSPEDVARDIVDAGIPGVAEVRPAQSQDGFAFFGYGPSFA